MHEIAMVEDVLRIVGEVARVNGISRIDKVNVVIGEYLMVKPSLFEFAFMAAREGTRASGAGLTIETEKVELECPGCRHRYSPQNINFNCPRCSNPNPAIIKGKEMYVKSIEGVDNCG